MKNRAHKELIGVITGLAMILTGVCLFISKTTVTSTFLESSGIWKWWSILLVFLPLIIGIILMIIKPRSVVPKLVSLSGATGLISVIMANTTIFIEEKIMPVQWFLYGFLTIGGLLICIYSLFIKKKK